MRTGAGVGGSDRVTLTWPDGAILKTWLQVTLSGSGLSTPDVFYFGNALGESGDSLTQATVAARIRPRAGWVVSLVIESQSR